MTSRNSMLAAATALISLAAGAALAALACLVLAGLRGVEPAPRTTLAPTAETARPGSAPDGVDYMTPEDAARVILRGLDRGAPMIPVGRIARLSWWINRLSPRLFQHLMERNMPRQPGAPRGRSCLSRPMATRDEMARGPARQVAISCIASRDRKSVV